MLIAIDKSYSIYSVHGIKSIILIALKFILSKVLRTNAIIFDKWKWVWLITYRGRCVLCRDLLRTDWPISEQQRPAFHPIPKFKNPKMNACTFKPLLRYMVKNLSISKYINSINMQYMGYCHIQWNW